MHLDARAAAKVLRNHTELRSRLGIVLGSGFQGVAKAMTVETTVPYAALPGFPQPAVAGHAGQVLIGRLADTPVVLLSGRAHFYEGHSMEVITFPVRVLAEFGVRDLLLTNAAGGIERTLRPGDFMVLTDHINWIGSNPLRGPVRPGLPRFVDLTRVYDARLSHCLRAAGRVARVPLRRGVYLAVGGPSYETPAEIRAFARLGAHAVGMSTVPEAIVARQCGLAVAGLSCITNRAAGRGKGSLSHAEVLAVGQRVERRAARLLEAFAKQYGEAA